MSSPVAPEQGGTTSLWSTASTAGVKKALRRWMLDFVPPTGPGRTSARAVLKERLFVDRAHDITVFPYAVLRLHTSNSGMYHGMRLDGTLEVMVYGRPWAQQEVVEGVGDLFDQSMLCLVLNHSGLIFSNGSMRDVLPAGPTPTDSEVVALRLSYGLAIWPAFLTSLTRVLPPSE